MQKNIIIVLVVLCLAFIALAFIFFSAKSPSDKNGSSQDEPSDDEDEDGYASDDSEREQAPRRQTISLHHGDSLLIEVVRDKNGIRTSDAELCPDIIDDTPVPRSSADRDFWTKISQIDSLPTEERRDLIRKLSDFGFIYHEQAGTISVSESDPDKSSENDNTPEHHDQSQPAPDDKQNGEDGTGEHEEEEDEGMASAIKNSMSSGGEDAGDEFNGVGSEGL